MDKRAYIGQLVDGKYQLVDLLGEGGMAAVYLADHTVLHQKVALKVLRSEKVKDPSAIKRFYREAQATAAIAHPAIVNIFDAGQAPWGEPYLAMEYLKGESLGTLIERVGVLSLSEAAALITPVLEALSAAHQAGIVHRDLKPENIFLAKNEAGGVEVKIIDFGVSKFTRQAGNFTQLTQLGAIVGTPHYMPIEQLLGQEIDHRADIYACGVVLYEMLTGRRPFDAPNYTAVLGRIMSQKMTPPHKANPAFPRQAEPLILKAMSREPKDRYASAAAMRLAVSAIASDEVRFNGAKTMATRVSSAFVGLGDLGRPEPPTAQFREPIDTVDEERPATVDTWSGSGTHRGPSRGLGLMLAGVFVGSLLVTAGIIGAVLVFESRSASREDKAKIAALPTLPEAPEAPVAATTPQTPRVTEAPSPRPDSVRIHLIDLPSKARVQFDGGLVAANPFRVKPRSASVPLRVVAEGFNAFELAFIPDKDTTIVVQMTPKPTSRSRRHRNKAVVLDDSAAPLSTAPARSTDNDDDDDDYRLHD
ncbi:MAG: serine/threonine protein kinase [Myxococcota bacterium]|nr:serine/threonine protein kinase [Myxococcota bacterium]